MDDGLVITILLATSSGRGSVLAVVRCRAAISGCFPVSNGSAAAERGRLAGRPTAMANFLTGARLSRRRIVFPLTSIVVAVGVAIGLAVWPSADAAAATIPSGARVVTVTPVFGRDPNISRHHLDHAFTITDPAKVARIAGIINDLAPFPIGVLSCAADNRAAMRLTFRTSVGARAIATVLATYTGCSGVARPDAPNMPFLEDYTNSGQQVQRLALAIAGVRWPYTPDVLPPFSQSG